MKRLTSLWLALLIGFTLAIPGYAQYYPPAGVPATYTGQSTITTVGTIVTGVWNGTAISSTYLDTQVALKNAGNTWTTVQVFTGGATPATAGGTTLGTAALPFSSFYVGNAATNNIQITGTATGARTFTLPDANSVAVQPDTGASNNFLTAISATGAISKAQPSFSNLSGAATDAQLSAAQKASAFGGDGSGGALNLSATESTIMQYNGTTVSVADGATESMLGPSVINATSTITIGGGASGVLKEAGNGGLGGTSQSAGTTGAWGGGPALIINTSTALVARSSGGAGASYTNGGGGAGGGGGWASAGAGGASGGGGAAGAAGFLRSALHGSYARDYVGAGGGSGAGGQGTASTAGGNGGDGLILCAVGNITVASGAILSCDGVQPSTPGTDATGHGVGGGGGGGGGFLRAYSLGQVTVAGTMRANGGAGGTGGAAKAATNGNGGGGGGGGGGGIVLRMSTSAPNGAGTVQSNGGALGSGGAKDGVGTIGVNGNGGSNSTPLAITGSPNLPLILAHQKWVPGVMAVIAQAHCNGEHEYRMHATENSSMLAACETVQRGETYTCFMQMNNHLLASTEWVPDNLSAILRDPDKVQAKLDAFTCETLTNPEHGLYCGGLGEIAGDQS
jgi:hypothetical protein